MKRLFVVLLASALLTGIGITTASPALAVPPETPVITHPTDQATVDTRIPVISGTAEELSTVIVTIDGVEEGTAVVTAGAWDFALTEPLAEGQHTVSAAAVNAGSESSASSSPVTFVVDTIAPSRPTITNPTAGSIVTDSRPVVSGRAEPHTMITMNIDAIPAGSTTVDASGDWQLSSSIVALNGVRSISVRSQDPAGNQSLARTVMVTVDAPAPPTPTILSPVDNSTSTETSPRITGTAQPATRIIVTLDEIELGDVATDATGSWAFPVPAPLTQGVHAVAVRALNESGLESDPSELVRFTIETPTIETPTIEIPTTSNPPHISSPPEVEAGPAPSPRPAAPIKQTTPHENLSEPNNESVLLAQTGSKMGAVYGLGAVLLIAGLASFLKRRGKA